MDRTIASARSFLSGLYSLDKNNGKIQAKGPFEIEVHNFPDEDMVSQLLSFEFMKNFIDFDLVS